MIQSRQILLAVVGLVAAAGVFYMLVLSPKRDEASTLSADIAKAEQNLEAAKALLASNEQAKAGYKQAYTSVVRLGKAVPADDDVRSLMVQLDEAARASRVDFRSIQVGSTSASVETTSGSGSGAASQPLPPGATVGPAGFPMMPFSFTFKGSFFKLSDFMSRLERFVTTRNAKIGVTGRLMTLDSIQLEPDQTGFPNIKASVGATTFLVPPTEGVTNGATPTGPAPAQAGTPESGTAPPTTTATTTGAIR